MNPFINYTDKKNTEFIQVIDLRHQVNRITPQRIQLFEKFNTDPANVNNGFFVLLIRHRQIEMISDGNKIIEVEVV